MLAPEAVIVTGLPAHTVLLGADDVLIVGPGSIWNVCESGVPITELLA